MGLLLQSIQPSSLPPRFPGPDPHSRHEYMPLHGTTAALVCEILTNRGVMDGMLEPPPFPAPPEPQAAHFDREGHPLTLEARAYLGEMETIRRLPCPDGLIAAYKLRSPEGWVVSASESDLLARSLSAVTHAEIERQARNLGRQLTEQTGTEYWPIATAGAVREWRDLVERLARFCQACGNLGGFRVM